MAVFIFLSRPTGTGCIAADFTPSRWIIGINDISTFSQNNRGCYDLIFCHILEPHSFAEKYIDSLVRVLQALGVKRYCRIGAMYDSGPHTREIPVTVSINGQWTSSTGQARTQRRRRPYQGPTTIMSLVGDRLEQQGVENMTFMARFPQYL